MGNISKKEGGVRRRTAVSSSASEAETKREEGKIETKKDGVVAAGRRSFDYEARERSSRQTIESAVMISSTTRK